MRISNVFVVSLFFALINPGLVQTICSIRWRRRRPAECTTGKINVSTLHGWYIDFCIRETWKKLLLVDDSSAKRVIRCFWRQAVWQIISLVVGWRRCYRREENARSLSKQGNRSYFLVMQIYFRNHPFNEEKTRSSIDPIVDEIRKVFLLVHSHSIVRADFITFVIDHVIVLERKANTCDRCSSRSLTAA